MSLISEQNTFTADVARLINFIHDNGIIISFGECWRPEAMQRIYFLDGKSKTMKNSHGDRLAIDLNFFRLVDGEIRLIQTKDELQFIGDYWTGLDAKNVWGGNWKTIVDCPHFERKVV